MPDPRRRSLIALLVGALVITTLIIGACSSRITTSIFEEEKTDVSSDETFEESAEETMTLPGEEPLFTASYKPNGKEIAVVQTSKGVVRLELYSDAAPNHVASFVELAQEGFYDGVKFHRVVSGFVVQGGDPQTKDFTPEEVAAIVTRQAAGQHATGEPALGTGGPGYRVAQEFNSRQHLKGTLAMARSQDPDSGGSQFYICLAPQPSLDGQYTVFGQVIEGMDVVEKIAVGDEIVSLSIENATQ